MHIQIIIIEPWELGEVSGWQSFSGEVLTLSTKGEGGSALIRLNEAIRYKGNEANFILATPRHSGTAISQLGAGRSVICACSGIADEQATAVDPFGETDLHGRLAFIGEIVPDK